MSEGPWADKGPNGHRSMIYCVRRISLMPEEVKGGVIVQLRKYSSVAGDKICDHHIYAFPSTL